MSNESRAFARISYRDAGYELSDTVVGLTPYDLVDRAKFTDAFNQSIPEYLLLDYHMREEECDLHDILAGNEGDCSYPARVRKNYIANYVCMTNQITPELADNGGGVMVQPNPHSCADFSLLVGKTLTEEEKRARYPWAMVLYKCFAKCHCCNHWVNKLLFFIAAELS